MHSVGTCLLMDEVGALTTSRRCEREHCVPRAPEIRQLIWKGGESSSQRQDAGGVTTSPGLQACTSLPFRPLPHGYLHLAPAPPHHAGGSAESQVGSEEVSKRGSLRSKEEGRSQGSGTDPECPRKGRLAPRRWPNFNRRTDMRPRQASLPPPASALPRGPPPQRPQQVSASVFRGPTMCRGLG